MSKNKKKDFEFSNLQIGDNDLVGDKFNGHNLHKYLRESKIDSVSLVWNKESNDKNTYLISSKREDREEIKQIALDIQKGYSLNSINNPIAYDILYDELFLNTNVVHFHLIHNFIFDIQLLPIMTRLKPIVWTLHDPWSLGGHCIHHYECKKWKKNCGDCQYLDSHFLLEKDNSSLNFEIKKQSIQNSNFEVIVASKWMKEKVSQSPIFKGKKINIIPFGINQKVFKPINKDNVKKELGIPNDSFIITFRCDYSGFKGMDYIDYVLKNIKTKKNIYILAVANTYNIKIKNITCINFGWVKDNSLLSKIYGITDLFLAPSSADSFGMMVVEIMSCGVLPIVLEGTALPETVNSPECGVSTKRIKKEYFKVVQYYIEHDEERNERSKKCLEFAKKNYNKDLYLNKIIKVYKEAIKNHNTTEDDKHLLSQLKKYMMVGSFKPIFKKPENKIKRFKKIKMMIRKIVIICFYKVDKFFPKKIRKKMKTKLVKFNFVRKYLIK